MSGQYVYEKRVVREMLATWSRAALREGKEGGQEGMRGMMRVTSAVIVSEIRG